MRVGCGVVLSIALSGACATKAAAPPAAPAAPASAATNPAAGVDSRALTRDAHAAYQAKQFATCAKLYTEVAANEPPGQRRMTAHYNAACCLALDHQADAAFQQLDG